MFVLFHIPRHTDGSFLSKTKFGFNVNHIEAKNETKKYITLILFSEKRKGEFHRFGMIGRNKCVLRDLEIDIYQTNKFSINLSALPIYHPTILVRRVYKLKYNYIFNCF